MRFPSGIGTLIRRHELHGNRVDAVSRVFCGEPLSIEDVTQVAIAVSAKDFHSVAIGIDFTPYGTFDFVIKRGPATMGMELVLWSVQWCFTLFADVVAAWLKVIGVLAGEWHFGPLMQDDLLFFSCQFGVCIHG